MYLITVVLLLNFIRTVFVLNNGQALKPPMGWMSWGYYMCGDKCKDNPEKCLDEKLIMKVADTFFKDGYQEAGFEYIIIDDCWSEQIRNMDGYLVPDRLRFPNGMKYLADYIHSRGLKFGMYMNIASTTCMYYPGSRGYLRQDAKQFAEWEVDYIKVDGCYVEEDYLDRAYIKLGKYINETGRPVVYSCSWPYYKKYIHKHKPDWSTVSKHCNVWRNFHDVSASWDSVVAIIYDYIKNYDTYSKHHGPGMWNDPDMLILGTGVLTNNQSKIQMSVYAMMSAPLLLSCNMSRITPFERSLLMNMDLIALAQDPMGIMAVPYLMDEYVTLFVKPHLPKKGDQYPSFSLLLLNLDLVELSFSLYLEDYGLNATDGYSVLDVYSGNYVRNITLKEEFKVTAVRKDCLLYTLYPL